MRSLTVSSLYRPRRWESQSVPYVRLSGKWLARAGLTPGQRLTVRLEHGSLILTPEAAA